MPKLASEVMRIVVLTAILVCVTGVSRAAGAPANPVAYLERIDVYGDADTKAAREFVVRLLEASGYFVRVAHPSTAPCGEPACSGARAQEMHAAVAVRAAVLGLAGEVTVTFSVVDAKSNREARHTRAAVDLHAANGALTQFLIRASKPVSPKHQSKRAAWLFTGTAVALATAAGGAMWNVRAREDAFFADHVDAMGRVFGISRADAEAHEASTRRWQLLGALLLTGAVVAGSGATYLFVVGDRDAPSGGGVGVTGEF